MGRSNHCIRIDERATAFELLLVIFQMVDRTVPWPVTFLSRKPISDQLPMIHDSFLTFRFWIIVDLKKK